MTGPPATETLWPGNIIQNKMLTMWPYEKLLIFARCPATTPAIAKQQHASEKFIWALRVDAQRTQTAHTTKKGGSATLKEVAPLNPKTRKNKNVLQTETGKRIDTDVCTRRGICLSGPAAS